MGAAEWAVLGVAAWVAFTIYRGYRRGTTAGAYVCADCGTQGHPETQTKGSILIEIILWLCLIVPGLIYSIWRLTTRHRVCPACGHDAMIPVASPRGRELLGRFKPK